MKKMETVPLVWINPKIGLPPVLEYDNDGLKYSDWVLAYTLDYGYATYVKAVYDHKKERWFDEQMNLIDKVIKWAKVILPKSEKYNELNLNPINYN